MRDLQLAQLFAHNLFIENERQGAEAVGVGARYHRGTHGFSRMPLAPGYACTSGRFCGAVRCCCAVRATTLETKGRRFCELGKEDNAFYVFNHHQVVGGFTLSDLLDKLWSQVSSLLPPSTRLHFYRA